MKTLKQLSIDEKKNFPKNASVLRENFYLDNVLWSTPKLGKGEAL